VQHAQLLLAPDQPQVEAARDRGRVGVERAEEETAFVQRRGTGGVADDLPGRLGQADLPAPGGMRVMLGDADRLADHRRVAGGDDLAGAGAGADA
jgi:hypothetical protein